MWLSLVLATVACGSVDARPAGASDRPLVLTTFTVLGDMVAEVGGVHVEVSSITKVGAEIHGYEPTPADLRGAREAALILDNGLGLEAWFERFVADLDVPHAVLSDGIDPIPIAGSDEPNPHAWMSPRNAGVYVDNIAAALADLDPDHAGDFAHNAERYRSELTALHDDLVAALAVLPDDQRALVTCEGAFSYLAADAGLVERYIWPVNAERQATPRRVAGVIDFVRHHDVPAVFCESTVSDAAVRQVVDATGARFGGVLHVDSLSAADGPVPTYLELIRHDVDVIVAGLVGG